MSGLHPAAPTGTFGLWGGRPNGLAAFPDGLSSTIGMSEWNLSSPDFRDNAPSRATFETEEFALPDEFDDFVAGCRDLDPLRAPLGAPRGQAWFADDLGNTLFTADMLPNQPTCHDLQWVVMSTAGSSHPGQVNVLFGDGHVQPVANSVALPTWRAFSTRAGAEIIDASALR